MNTKLATSQFLGASVAPTAARRPTGARQALKVHAGPFDSFPRIGRPDSTLSKKDRDTVKRGQQGQVKKAGKLLPKDPKKMERKPEQAARLFNARNLPRQGGAAGGGPWQKIDPKTPGYRGIPTKIDPLIFTGGLIAGFLALAIGLVSQG